MGMQKIDGKWEQQEGVGLAATVERRKTERASRKNFLEGEMLNVKDRTNSYENQMKIGKKYDMYSDGKLKTESDMLQLLKDQGVTSKYAVSKYMEVYHAEKLRVDELKKQKELNAADAKELKDKEETLRIQDVLESSILKLQADSIRISDKSLQTQKTLSELKPRD